MLITKNHLGTEYGVNKRDKQIHPAFDSHVVNLETGEFTVEFDIPPIARDIAKILTDRYHESNKHWKEGEDENAFYGMLGELCFSDYLYQYDIPTVYNNPIFQQRMDKRPYDYRIPRTGSVEVKSYTPGASKRNLLVKVSEWKGSDYVVAAKFDSQEHGRWKGWLRGEEVEKLPIDNFGKAECYYRPLDELRPFKEFHELLLQNVSSDLPVC